MYELKLYNSKGDYVKSWFALNILQANQIKWGQAKRGRKGWIKIERV